MLLIFIVTFNYEQFVEITKTPNQLSAETHERVNAVILSIILVICVIMFYFKGNFNYDKESESLKIVAKIWIVLNAILVISAVAKNSEYILNFGLPYKRFGVYEFLILALIGLILTFYRIQVRKINAFLFNEMFWCFYGTMLVCSFINWGGILSSQKPYILKQLHLNKMKKLLFLIPLLIMSCSKKEEVISNSLSQDSMKTTNQNKIQKTDDSLQGVINVLTNIKPKEIAKTFRVIDGDSIIKTINGDMIPLTITDEFTTDHQKFVLKIKNFNGKKIVGKITPENSQMNIRFNQIKLANGEYDGPFGRDLKYDIKKEGEIWLIIGKSNMASGDATGKFNINLE